MITNPILRGFNPDPSILRWVTVVRLKGPRVGP